MRNKSKQRICARLMAGILVGSLIVPEALKVLPELSSIPIYAKAAQTATPDDAVRATDANAMVMAYFSEDFTIEGTTLTKYSGTSSVVEIPEEVEIIGERAFAENTHIKEVIFPDSLREIKDAAFRDSTLERAVLPEGLETIGAQVFMASPQNTSYLTYVEIPDTIKKIESQVFSGCTKLKELELPPGLTEIGNSAFYRCSGLTEIQIPEGVTLIGISAFDGCSSLKTIEFPESLKVIESYAFQNCQNLEEAEFRNISKSSLESVRNGSFRNTKITDIVFPESLKYFGGCTPLSYSPNLNKRIKVRFLGNQVIPDQSTSIDDKTGGYLDIYAPEDSTELLGRFNENGEGKSWPNGSDYSGWKYYPLSEYKKDESSKEEESNFKIVDGVLTEYTGNSEYVGIPYNVFEIADEAFKDNNTIVYLMIPRNVTKIGESAFEHCEKLKTVYIEGTNVSIGEKSFYNCPVLNEVRCNGKGANFGSQAFGKCPELTDVSLYQKRSETVTFADDAFNHQESPDMKFYVEEESDPLNYALKHGIPYTVKIRIPQIKPNMFKMTGRAGNSTMDGPSVKALGKEFTIFKIPLKNDGDSKLAELLKIRPKYYPETHTLRVIIGDDSIIGGSADLGDSEEVDESKEEKIIDLIDDISSKLKEGVKEDLDEILTDISCLQKLGWKAFDVDPKVKDNVRGWKKIKAGLEFDSTFCGYLQADLSDPTSALPVYGKYIAVLSCDWEMVSVGWPPAFYLVCGTFGLEGSVGASLKMEIKDIYKLTIYDNISLQGKLNAEIGPYLQLAVGATTMEDVADIKARLTAKINASYEFPMEALAESFKASFNGNFTLTGHFLGSETEWINEDFLPIQIYPRKEKFRMASQTIELTEADLTPISRSYLGNPDAVYPYAMPQIVSFADGSQLRVWEDDVSSRSAIDRTSLFYSIKSADGSWSEPKQIADDGTADFEPKLVSDGESACVVWQNTKQAFVTDISVEEQASAIDLYWSSYDRKTDTWSHQEAVTDNDGIYEYHPVISVSSEGIAISWVEKNSENVFYNKDYKVKIAIRNDGQWEEKLLYEGTSEVGEDDSLSGVLSGITIHWDKDTPIVTYSITDTEAGEDEPQQITTFYGWAGGEGDAELLASIPGGFTVLGTESTSAIYGVIDRELATFDFTNGQISKSGMHFPSGAGNICIVKDDLSGKKALIWEQQSAESITETHLYGAFYNETLKSWGNAVKLVDGKGNSIQYPDACFDQNGNLQIIYGTAAIDPTTATAGSAIVNLENQKIEPECDLTITGMPWLEEPKLKPGLSTNLHVTVKNEGTMDLDGFNLEILDEKNDPFEEMEVITCNLPLLSGASKDVSINIILPDGELTGKKIKVRVQPMDGISDKNEKNNTSKTIELGLPDLTILNAEVVNVPNETGDMEEMLMVSIANNGYAKGGKAKLHVSADNSVFRGNAEAEFDIADSINIGETKTVSIPLSNIQLTLGEEGTSKEKVALSVLPEITYLRLETSFISGSIRENSYSNNELIVRYRAGSCIRPEYLTLNKTFLELMEGESAEIKATLSPGNVPERFKKFNWISSDDSIAYVQEEDGKVMIIGGEEGSADIEVTLAINGYDEVQTVCHINVLPLPDVDTAPSPSEVVVGTESVILTVGESSALTASVLPLNADQDIYWELYKDSSQNVISLDPETGEITALAAGEVFVIASAAEAENCVGFCRVSVLEEPENPVTVETSNSKELLALATAKVTEELSRFVAANTTTADAILEAVKQYIADITADGNYDIIYTGADITISWKENPVITEATKETEGSISGTILLSLGKNSQLLPVKLNIAKLNPSENDDPGNDNNPGADKPDDNKPDDNKPDDNKPSADKPGDDKPDDNKPGDNKPDDSKPGDNKPSNNKPGSSSTNSENTYMGGGRRGITDIGTWKLENGKWYYILSSGIPVRGQWKCIVWGGKPEWFYFDENGIMKIGWYWDGENWYYLHPQNDGFCGYMHTGWHFIDQKWYYFYTETGKPLGSMAADTVTPDGYTVGRDGAWIN